MRNGRTYQIRNIRRLGTWSLQDGVPGVRTEELGNEQLRRASSGDRVDDVQYGADDRNVYRTDRRQRMQNVRLDQDALDNEKMFKLQRSKSGHQERLTELNNKISVLLFDAKNEDAVKELVKLFNRQWKRFSLVHDEILLFANHNKPCVASAIQVYKEQVAKSTELFNKVSQYLQSHADESLSRRFRGKK